MLNKLNQIFCIILVFFGVSSVYADSPQLKIQNKSANTAIKSYLQSAQYENDVQALLRLTNQLKVHLDFKKIRVKITDDKDVVGGDTDLYKQTISIRAMSTPVTCSELRFRQVLIHELGHIVFIEYLRGKSLLTDNRFKAYIEPKNETEDEAEARYDKISAFDMIAPGYGELAADLVKIAVMQEPGEGHRRNFATLSPIVTDADYDDVHSVYNSVRATLWTEKLANRIHEEGFLFSFTDELFSFFTSEMERQRQLWDSDPGYRPNQLFNINRMKMFVTFSSSI